MKAFSRGKVVTIRPVKIVGDGSIATHGVGEGRMFPVVILDTRARPDVVEYIRIHRFSGPGDVRTTWGTQIGMDDIVTLMLQFQRPVELTLAIAFELRKAHSILIEGVLQTGGVYIQAGAEGDRIRTTMNEPKILVEVPDTGFAARFERICLAYLTKKIRRDGIDRRTAKRLAAEQYKLVKKFAGSRPFPS